MNECEVRELTTGAEISDAVDKSLQPEDLQVRKYLKKNFKGRTISIECHTESKHLPPSMFDWE